MEQNIADALRAPFALNEIEWRPSQGGLGKTRDGRPWLKILAYLNARAVMDRLDSVFGVGGWSHELRPVEMSKQAKAGTVITSGMICRITTMGSHMCFHEDVSDLTDIEDLKGGASGALKRAAVHLGIGRYLYDLGDTYAEIYDKGSRWHRGDEAKGIPSFKWDAPGTEWFQKYAPWMIPTVGPVLNPLIVKSEEKEDGGTSVKTPVEFPEGIDEALRVKIDGADLPKLKAWYAATCLKYGVSDHPWDSKWSREEAVANYLALSSIVNLLKNGKQP